MNSLERVVSAIRFEEPDQLPVIPQVFGHAAAISGVALDAYVQDGELIALCQMKALEKYRYDAVFTVMDVNVETEALGSVLRYRKGQYPVIEQYAFTREGDWSVSSAPDPLRAGRMPEMLKALRILRRDLGDEYLIVGCVLGPLTLASQLLGAEATLYMAIDEPERLGSLIDFSAEVITRFGLAQIQAGAHLPIVFDPFASPAVVPYQFFREFELPRLKTVCETFRRAGAVANWLHIAGPTQTILPFYPQAGVDIANFDYCVAPREAERCLPRACLDGNIKSLSFVEGSPEEIGAQASMLTKSFARRGGFILSSGCEIPPESRGENVAAMVEALRHER
ncbi:MAG: uroporphyrinogen decarboxylase family protein [Syntrophorhabdales bacterium]|jgi:uroporphyrinogen decarboxylase